MTPETYATPTIFNPSVPLSGLQRTDLVSTYALVVYLTIATHILRMVHFCERFPPSSEPALLCFHTSGRVPHPITLKTNCIPFRSLGVEYPINPHDSTSLSLMKMKLVISLRAIAIEKASTRVVNNVIAKCLYNRGAYVGVLLALSYKEARTLTKSFCSQNSTAHQERLILSDQKFISTRSVGGQGYQRISVLIQHRKRFCLNRALHLGDTWTRWAADALLRWGHRLHTVSLSASIPQNASPGFLVSSLIAFGWKGSACMTKKCSISASSACSPLHQSLLGSPLPQATPGVPPQGLAQISTVRTHQNNAPNGAYVIDCPAIFGPRTPGKVRYNMFSKSCSTGISVTSRPPATTRSVEATSMPAGRGGWTGSATQNHSNSG